MKQIQDIDIKELKLKIDEKIQYDRKAPKVLKKINNYYQNFLDIKSNSIDKTIYENEVQQIINKERNRNIKKMLTSLMHFVNDELFKTGTNFLELNYGNNEFFLQSVTKGNIKGTQQNILFMLRNTIISLFPKDYISLYPEVYLKFENYLKNDSDVLNWFNNFINDAYFSFKENEQKFGNYIQLLFENLSEEKKNEMLKRIESDNELKNVYDGLCKYADVYKYANKCRRQGKTLDNGLNEGIELYINSNKHLQNIHKGKDRECVIEYLHNSYYKTKYKKYNEF